METGPHEEKLIRRQRENHVECAVAIPRVGMFISGKESERMDEELQGKPTRRRHQTFRLGDTVRILFGPFVSFTGEIEGINQAKTLLKVKVAIYGRNNPIKLRFSDVENLSAQ